MKFITLCKSEKTLFFNLVVCVTLLFLALLPSEAKGLSLKKAAGKLVDKAAKIVEATICYKTCKKISETREEMCDCMYLYQCRERDNICNR